MEPSAAATAGPPPTPTPAPTLDWANVGYKASVKSPVSIGSKETITLTVPIGPTCTIKVRYPSGSYASLPSPTHPSAGTWRWTWTIPSGAHAGQATGTSTCTYSGLAKSGDISFKIVNPALPGGWTIKASLPASRSSTETGWLNVTVTIVGSLPPSNTSHEQQLLCDLELNGGARGQWATIDWGNPTPSVVISYDGFANLGPSWIGTANWSLTCRNGWGDVISYHTVTGTIQITP